MVAASLGMEPQEVDGSLLDPTPAERLYAASLMQRMARGWQESGVLPRPPVPLDATFTECVRMWRQALAFGEAMQIMRSWWQPGIYDDRTLGGMLKIIPLDVAAQVIAHLRVAFPGVELEPDLTVPEERGDDTGP